MERLNCKSCVHYQLKIGNDSWGSSQPHPCSWCLGNEDLEPRKDNFQSTEEPKTFNFKHTKMSFPDPEKEL